jgi:pullulanase/glycogen debranching enzyme
MHVDGFRFDLATVLGAHQARLRRDGPFFGHRAGPGAGRRQADRRALGPRPRRLPVGRFPRGWLPNGTTASATRCAPSGWAASARAASSRAGCAASSDLFEQRGRAPSASVNYVVSHDGFTLRDLVSYDLRHNQANGEDNRDGTAHNLSWNCGVEGDTGDARVLGCARGCSVRCWPRWLLAQGTPMLAAGAELGHSQQGNNNAYCQDNPTSWIDWSRADATLLEFCAQAIALRRTQLPLGASWHVDTPPQAARLHWRLPDGRVPAADDWQAPAQAGIGVLITLPGRGTHPLLLLVNPGDADLDFALPAARWQPLLQSAEPLSVTTAVAGPLQRVPARSLVLLQRQEP